MNKFNKVVVGLSGGLGNQMFQYAAGRALSLKLNVPLKLDLSWFLGSKDRAYTLNAFAIKGSLTTPFPLLPRLLRRFEARLSRRWGTARMGVPILREPHFHFDSKFEFIEKPVYLEGYWQSPNYFNHYASIINDDFSPISSIPEHCKPLLQKINALESICVHVRRGDYVANPTAAKVHGICPIEYYQRAISILTKDMTNPHCFIFSDDPDWVRNSLYLTVPSTVVNVNSALDANWDLYLMRACTHFVIANSSLSWWGAWLGQAPEKRVIAPKRWFMDPSINTLDLIPKEWERID